MTGYEQGKVHALGSLRLADGEGLVRIADRYDTEPGEHVIEVRLTPDGDRTSLVLEERGMPADQLAAYGAGIQVHAEHLAAPLAGRELLDGHTRWTELLPAYQDLPVHVD